MINIFVANLDFGITSDDLMATFSQFGKVAYSHVVYDSKTKKSKGYGYVEMENQQEAINAIEALNGMEVEGRALDIKIATPKESRVKKEGKPKPNFKKSSYSNDNYKSKENFKAKSFPKQDEGKRIIRPRRKRNEE